MESDQQATEQENAASHWISFDGPVVFISASRDMAMELDVCRRVVEDVARDLHGSDSLEPYVTDIKIAPFPMEAVTPETETVETFTSGQMLLCNSEVLLEELAVVSDPFPAEAIRNL